MKKTVRWKIAALVLCLLVLGALTLDGLSSGYEANIQLPDPERTPDTGSAVQEEVGGLQREDYSPVALTPSNVQAAVTTLARPEVYTMTATVTRSYGGKSRETQVTVVADGDRCYSAAVTGSVTRYRIRTGDSVTFWENQGTRITAPLGEFTDDGEAGLLTWEDVSALDASQIVNAGYTRWNDRYCIMFTAETDGAGTTYFVDVDTGLLVYASVTMDGETVYTQTAESVTVGEADESVFDS